MPTSHTGYGSMEEEGLDDQLVVLLESNFPEQMVACNYDISLFEQLIVGAGEESSYMYSQVRDFIVGAGEESSYM